MRVIDMHCDTIDRLLGQRIRGIRGHCGKMRFISICFG